MPARLLLAALLLPALAGAQGAGPGAQITGQQETTLRDLYGEPRFVELTAIALDPENYHRRHVRTHGYLSPFQAGYFLLSGGGNVLVIPMPGQEGLVQTMTGRRVEVTGVTRRLPVEQQRLRSCGLESQCDDPELPPLPNARADWPRGSLTLFSASDLDADRPSSGRPASELAAALRDPAAHAGRKIRVVGMFRGRNLHGDLPEGSVRGPADWVLKDGEHAVWVVGKPPRGKGFDLDLDYRPDTGRWLEVIGRLEVRGEVAWLHASKVSLTTAPRVERAEDHP